MASALQQQQFVSQYGPYAQQAGAALGVSPNVILGQWAQESGWGTPTGAAAGGNMAGITQAGGGYATYATPQDFTNAYISTLQNPRYASALNTGSNSQAFVSGLQTGGYFTGSGSVYQTNVASNAATISQINPQLATGQFAQGPADTGLGGSTVFGGGTGTTSDPYTFSMDVTPTPSPSTSGGTTSAGTSGTASNVAGNLGADVGFLPPAATGGPQATGLAPGVVNSITGWINSIESAVGTTFKNAWDATVGQVENLTLRFFIVLAAVAIIIVALWRLLDPDSSKITAMLKAVPEAA